MKRAIPTPPCPHCGRDGYILAKHEEYRRWASGELHIQDAMPDMPAHEREQLLTGFHQKCWEEIFGTLDEFYEELS